MIIVYLVLGFCIASFIFLVGMCFQRKKIKDELLSMLKMNSQNYLKYFVNMANKKDFKLKNILDLIRVKFEKIYENSDDLNQENYVLRKIIDIVDEGILILNKDNVIYYLNDELKELFNLSNIEELFNKNLKDTSLKWILDFENLNFFEVPNKYTSINISCYVVEICNDLRVYKFKNVSEYKKLDYMSKEFVSNITHELKTPLTSIIGFSETLKNVEDENDRQMFYDIINREAIRLNNLISDILIFSEIETQNDLSKQTLDRTRLLYSIKQLLYPQIHETNFKIKISDDKVVILNCEKYIRQIFINIMDNSIKHSFGTTLNINCSEDNENIYVNFSDDGIGIPEEEIKNIFDRFYKVLNSKSKFRGTGLGLSIVQSSIQKINAKIGVFNNVDKGVTFKVIIPKK